jgi:uncharacterized membrane protein
MKTIAQQLKIKEFPFEIRDSKGNRIYWEDSEGYWSKAEYDSNGNRIYHENSTGYWCKLEYDSNGKEIYWEDQDGSWSKWQYDSNGKEIYYETSDGTIKDLRPKTVELTMDEIAKKFGIDVNNLKIKK